jgi:hypothetical protein
MGGCLRHRQRGQQRCCPLWLKPNRHWPARSRFTANFGLDSLMVGSFTFVDVVEIFVGQMFDDIA